MDQDELIKSLLYPSVFDADATRAMGEAYDKVQRMLHDKGQPAVVREVIARKIIELAGVGERNPDLLAHRALEELGLEVKAEQRASGAVIE